MFPSCTRVTASVGFCWAVVFIAEARDSSSGGGAWVPEPPPAPWLGAAAATGGGGTRPAPDWLPTIQPTSTPKNTPATPMTRDSLDTVDHDDTPSQARK